MIRVKCNIHSWMRAFIGVVEHPYFAVTASMEHLKSATFLLAITWSRLARNAGNTRAENHRNASGKIETNFTFKGK